MTPGAVAIVLANDCVTIVDEIDADLAREAWRVFFCGKRRYAIRSGRGIVSLHREVMRRALGLPLKDPAVHVDHVNGDGLDNRRSNLRLATNAQNQANRGAQANNTSGYKGVTFNSSVRKWQAQLYAAGRLRYLGVFDSIVQAAVAYDMEAMRLHGEFVRTNYSYPDAMREAAK